MKGAAFRDTAAYRDQHRQRRDPGQARAVAIVRTGDDSANAGIAEQCEDDGGGQQAQIVSPAA